jgi:hypothetical protein
MSKWEKVWRVVRVIGATIARLSGEADDAPRAVPPPLRIRTPDIHPKKRPRKVPESSTGE